MYDYNSAANYALESPPEKPLTSRKVSFRTGSRTETLSWHIVVIHVAITTWHGTDFGKGVHA